MDLVRTPGLLIACALFASGAAAQLDEPMELGHGPDPDCVTEVHASLGDTPPREETPAIELPEGRAIAALDARACHALLRQHEIAFTPLPDTEGVAIPVRADARQQAVADSLGCPAGLLEPLYAEIRDLLRGISLVKELSPRSLDYISSFGERMSVRCIADFFSREGLAADAHDVWDLGFVTDSRFGRARPVPGWEEKARAAVAALPEDRVPVVTGFVGKNAAGEITTVGRNGSDLTCTLLAAALEADEAQIWTDTDGVMTADPSVVSGARNIPHMRFDEAAELAYFGSRVLHPSTLLPALDAKIPVRVLNTNRPAHPGTVIADLGPENPERVTSIAYKERQTVVKVASTRMFGESGFLARVFEVLARHEVIVDVVTTSEVSVSLTPGPRGGGT